MVRAFQQRKLRPSAYELRQLPYPGRDCCSIGKNQTLIAYVFVALVDGLENLNIDVTAG